MAAFGLLHLQVSRHDQHGQVSSNVIGLDSHIWFMRCSPNIKTTTRTFKSVKCIAIYKRLYVVLLQCDVMSVKKLVFVILP